MKSRILKIILLTIFVGTLGFIFRNEIFNPRSTVKAFGDLIVNFHVLVNGDPMFTVSNMKPGDTTNHDIDVSNGGSAPAVIAIKAIRRNGVGNVDVPRLETALNVTIKDGPTTVYGPKTLQQFFSESLAADGVSLGNLPNGNTNTFNMQVDFPSSSGNNYQNKSVAFDISFGTITNDQLIINEVYYKVDPNHGLDSPKDRGITSQNGNNVTINVSGNGNNSTNKVTVNQSQACNIIQSNNTSVNNGVIIINNTGGNNVSKNTGGTTTIITGNSGSNVKITTTGSTNTANCGKKLGQNDEWIELYNPTDHDISLKNWSLTDNSGITVKINANIKIKKGGFALITKDASTWSFWNENPNAAKIQLGKQIGDGLDNGGDRLLLNNPAGTVVDAISWGTDNSILNPSITGVTISGNSLLKINPILIPSTATNWHEGNTSPGNSN